MRVITFDHPRPLTDWIEDGTVAPGHELGGLVLPPMALDALAQSKITRQPCEMAVVGEEWHDDGRHYLRFATTRDYIEAVTDYHHEDGGLHYRCPDCTQMRGRHARGCPRSLSR